MPVRQSTSGWKICFLIRLSKPTKSRIIVTGDKTRDEVEVVLRKKSGVEGIFTGSVPTRYGTTPVADETLDVQGDEEIRATYTPNFSRRELPRRRRFSPTPTKEFADISQSLGADGTPVRHFNIGIPLHFRLEDADLNLDAFKVESTELKGCDRSTGNVNYPL